jgi:hypothetical protein
MKVSELHECHSLNACFMNENEIARIIDNKRNHMTGNSSTKTFRFSIIFHGKTFGICHNVEQKSPELFPYVFATNTEKKLFPRIGNSIENRENFPYCSIYQTDKKDELKMIVAGWHGLW